MAALREALDELPETVFADLLESNAAYLLIIDLPGATEETIDVAEQNGVLKVEARREKDVPAGFEYRQEDRSLFLDVSVPLPPDAVPEQASATIDRGVLEVEVPKRSSIDGKSIPITDSEG